MMHRLSCAARIVAHDLDTVSLYAKRVVPETRQRSRCGVGRDCERDVKRDRRKRKAAAEALTFASHGMNGSEGEAAGLLPAQQKPKRVRRRKSREQVIQPIAVDLQAVPPEQAPGVLGLEVPFLPIFSMQISAHESINCHCSLAHA